ncbi:hypothetical protein DDE82_004139 [Stemphylium lycopersici]|nr:hypothetical protein TW65_03743 [Stemphylium lycopersici]RAR05119.1 hypothetical protein DDE82_004139 [Stemphylium lycopersici]
MADQTLILSGKYLKNYGPAGLQDHPIDSESFASGEDDDLDEDAVDGAAEAADDPDDDDFRLGGYDGLGIPEEEQGDIMDEYEPEYDDVIAGQKRKRARLILDSKKNPSSTRPGIRFQPDDTAFILDEDNGFLNKRTTRVPGTFGRRNRRKGESLPAHHKRVSHELDSDDELMMQMREKGFNDRQIAEKLAKDGRVRYDQKSISTRIMRIRLAQAENVEFLLREGYKEWKFEDDERLIRAYALADIEVNYEIERIRAWRFRKVSEYMRRLHKDALFSATACRERYNALVDGTARIPTELDDDPNTRRAQLEAYRISREKIRNKEQAEKEAREAAEAKAKNEAKSRNAEKAEEIANKRAVRETEKAQRAMTRAAEAQVRAQRAQENQNAKAHRNAQLKRQKQAQEDKKRAAAAKKSRKKNTAAFALTSAKNVSQSTPDPRSYLSISDLRKMVQDRGLALSTFSATGSAAAATAAKKNKEILVQALKDADDEFSQADLRKMCKSKGLYVAGTKLQMKYQLALQAAQACTSFESGAAGADQEGGEAETDSGDEMEVDAGLE